MPWVDQNTQVDALAFLKNAITVDGLQGMIGQVLETLAQALEKCMGGQLQLKHGELQLMKLKWEDMILGDSTLPPPHQLCTHVENGRQALVGETDLSCSTDKGWAQGYPYQVTVFCQPQNCAVLAIPVVASLELAVSV